MKLSKILCFYCFANYLIRILRILDEVIKGDFIMTNMTKRIVLLCLGIIPNAFSMNHNTNFSSSNNHVTTVKQKTNKRKRQLTVACNKCLTNIIGINVDILTRQLSKHKFSYHGGKKFKKFNTNFNVEKCGYGVDKYYYATCYFARCFKSFRGYATSTVKNNLMNHVCCSHNPDKYNENKEYVKMCYDLEMCITNNENENPSTKAKIMECSSLSEFLSKFTLEFAGNEEFEINVNKKLRTKNSHELDK